MKRQVILDTGPLVAFLNGRNKRTIGPRANGRKLPASVDL